MFLGALRDSGRAISSSWWRLLLVQVLVAFAAGTALLALSVSARAGATGVFAWISADPAASDDRVSAAGFALALLVAAIGLPLFSAGTAALIVLVDEGAASGDPRLASALARGIRSAVRAVAALVPAVAAVVVAFVLAPVISAVGLVGLVVSGAVFAVRRRTRPQARWAWRAWTIIAVPFGVLWFVLPPAILAVPAAVLDRAWPRVALTRAAQASCARRGSVLAVWVLSVALFAGALLLIATAATPGGSALVSYATGIAQLVLAPLPVIAATVLYRRAGGPRPAPASALSSSAPSLLAAPSGVLARVATVTVVALLLPLGVVASGSAASAAGTTAAREVFVVTSDEDTTDAAALAAQQDACTTGSGACTFRAAVAVAESLARAGAPRATVRFDGPRTVVLSAPVRFEPDTAPSTGGGDNPGEETPPSETPPTEQPPTEQPPTEQPTTEQPPSDTPPSDTPPTEQPPTETPAPEQSPTDTTPTETPAPLDEQPQSDEQPQADERPQGRAVDAVVGAPASVSSAPLAAVTDVRGLLTIEGAGSILDGQNRTQILRVASEKWDLSVSDLTFRDGTSADFAGGLLAGVSQTTLVRTVFRGNSAPYGAGALFTQRLTVDASAFFGNSATGWSETTWGGAIRAAGDTRITNSTFSANRIGDSVGASRNQGTDVYAETAMTVVNSTFVDSVGGSLTSPNGTSTVRNSVFSVTDGITPGLACSGTPFVLSDNLHQQGDGSCVTGDTHTRLPYTMLGQLDETGPVPFYPLRLTADNGALGAGADCPSSDARGNARPAQGCDLGAVQADGGSSLRVTATADEQVGARATFRATVAGVSGAQPRGRITFTIGDRTVGPLELTESSAPAEHGVDTAVAVVDDLPVGSAVTWSAAFAGDDGFRDSASTAQSLTLTPVGTFVTLTCAAANGTGVCAGSDWPVASGATLQLDVAVSDTRAGTVVIASDAAGTTTLGNRVATVGGRASIGIRSSALPDGRTPLFAVFTSDDGRVQGASLAGPAATKRAAATVEVKLNAAQATYGDAKTARATVTVTGTGATPTGTVFVTGAGTIALDATGRADVDLSLAPFATTSFTAQYSGDAVYAPVTSAAAGPFRFTPADVSVRVTGTQPASPVVGRPFVVLVETESVAPSTTVHPLGDLTLLVDGAPVPGATATSGGGGTGPLTTWTVTLPADALGTGEHTLRAVFRGGTGFTDAESTTVSSSIGLAGTTTTLVATPDHVAFDGSITLRATVTAAGDSRTPAGEVVFSRGDTVLGTVTLAGCDAPAGCAQASLGVAASTIDVGDRTVTARYVGGDLFAPSITAPVAVTVTPAAAVVQLTLPRELAFGVGGGFTVSVAAGATRPAAGVVAVTALAGDGSRLDLGTVALRDGAGTLTLAPGALPVGSYTVTAAFAGDARFAAASADRPLAVSSAKTVIGLDAYVNRTLTWGGTHNVGVTVSTTGRLGPEGEVVLRWRGHEVGSATLSSADDAGEGRRHVVVTAHFDFDPDAIGSGALTAVFRGADGFSGAFPGEGGSPADSQSISVVPIDAVTGITSSIAFGQRADATATVTVPGTALVARGTVTFTLSAPGVADRSATTSVTDGRASLHDTELGGVVVDRAGSWVVSLRYNGPIGDARYVARAPGDFAFVSVNLHSTAAVVTATPTASSVEARGTLTADIRVTAPTSPGGTVRLRSEDNRVEGPAVAVVNGVARATFPMPADWANSDRAFVAEYSGDTALSSATSAAFTVRVVPTATRVVVEATDPLAPVVLVGSTTSFTIRTSAGSAPTPEGFFTLSRDGREFARAPIGADGATRVRTTVREAASGPITATFTPLEAGYAPSTGTTSQDWALAPVTVTVRSDGATVGRSAAVSASVAYDAARYPTLGLEGLPASAPTGTVLLDAGSGIRCTMDLTPDATRPHASTGSCDLLFRTAWHHPITATYTASNAWESRSVPAIVVVTTGQTSVSLSAPTDAWVGLSTIPVRWSVAGPAVGTVSVLLAGTEVCTSAAMSGSCSVALPASAEAGAALTLRYRGGGLDWSDADATVQNQIIACVPTPATDVSPSGTGTVTLLTAPTCGAGTGYRVDTDVLVQATTPDDSVVTGLTLDTVPVADLTTGATIALTTLRLPLRVIDGSTPLRSRLLATTGARCVPVSVGTSGLDDRLLAVNIVEWMPQADCGRETRVADGRPVAMLRVGSDFTVSLRTDRIPAHTKLLTWEQTAGTQRSFPEGDAARASTYSVRVAADTKDVRALFGPVCYGLPTVVQPTNGRITLTPPAQNCGDPYTGLSGWLRGTTVSGELQDATAGTRNYFDGWAGDTSRFADVSSSSRTTTHALRFTVSERPFTIAATYAACVALKTDVIGNRLLNGRPPGIVSVDTESNCPAGSGTGQNWWFRDSAGGGERWFRSGTSVTLTSTLAANSPKTTSFLGWTGITGGDAAQATTTTTLTSDAKAVAAFGDLQKCMPVRIQTAPAGVLNVAVDWGSDGNVCDPTGSRPLSDGRYDQGTGGALLNAVTSPASPLAVGADIVWAWSAQQPPEPGEAPAALSNVWEETPALQQGVYGKVNAVAYACNRVLVDASVRAPDGTVVRDAGASNIAPAGDTKLSGFVGLPAADCSVGANPRSGRSGYSWQVGTPLLPVVLADSGAYRFTGWSGDVTGTGETPDQPLVLGGVPQPASGLGFHHRITANFTAICHRLTIGSDAAQMKVHTAPNCPGVDASQNMYLGNTSVVVQAIDGNALFRHWVSGYDAISTSDGHWATVKMTDDRTVMPYFSSKSAGEAISSVATAVGDYAAVSSKKLIGFVSAGALAFVKTLTAPIAAVGTAMSGLADMLEYFEVRGAFVDGLHEAAAVVESVLAMVYSPMECMTQWSSGGTKSMFYGIQNVVGGMAVGVLTADAAGAAKTVTTAQSKFAAAVDQAKKMKAAVVAAKERVDQAQEVIDAARAASASVDDDTAGLESTAYEAWGTQKGASVFSSCMSSTMGAGLDRLSGR